MSYGAGAAAGAAACRGGSARGHAALLWVTPSVMYATVSREGYRFNASATSPSSFRAHDGLYDSRVLTASALTKVQTAIVPPAGQDKETDGDDGGQEDVEDAEEDGARRHTDRVAAVRDAVRDRVEEPEQVHPTR